MIITNKTKLNAVIGFPLVHTKSPILHHMIYQILKLDAVLLAFPGEDLESFVQSVRTLPIGLVAVTMPFKEKILHYLDECCSSVEALKAVNTIINQNGKLKGYNTDVDGIAFALKDITLHRKNVLLIGAGGAARAAAYFLKKHFVNIFWYNRSKENALRIKDEFGGTIINTIHDIDDKIDIIINATPSGMFPENHTTPLPDFQFSAEQIVFDMIYHPINTTLLNNAKNLGAKIISGLDMFIGQGIRQIELWTGKKLCEGWKSHEIETILKKGLV